jgi:hypothetical protein
MTSDQGMKQYRDERAEVLLRMYDNIPPMFAHDPTKKVKAIFDEQVPSKRQRRREKGRVRS